jgi:hypothetical protein
MYFHRAKLIHQGLVPVMEEDTVFVTEVRALEVRKKELEDSLRRSLCFSPM